jgi:hypothetical protein
VKLRVALALIASLLGGCPAAAQAVQQTGNVTSGHIATWNTNGIIQDGGAVTANDSLSGGSTTSIGSGSTYYCATAGCATSAAIASTVPFTGTAVNLNVAVGTAPGAGQTITATLMAGPYGALVATSAICQISASITSCQDTTHQVNIVAGQTWAVRLVTSGAANSTTGETFGLQFISSVPPQPTSPYVLQSGNITSQHLTWWVTNGVIGDTGITVPSSIGSVLATLSTPPAFVIGDAACFANTLGVLQDCGAPNGNVRGPNSSVNGDLASFNGTGGGTLQDSGIAPAGISQNKLRIVTTNDTVLTTDCGKTLQLGTGSTGFFTETLPTVAGFPTNCVVTFVDGDSLRCKGLSGFPNPPIYAKVLCPTQSLQIGIINNAWAVLQMPPRWRPAGVVNFFTDFTNGSDVAGATDGLAAGASAFKSAEHCFLFAIDQIDFTTLVNTTSVLCNMALATADTQGMHVPAAAFVGSGASGAFQLIGASRAITGAVSNGGLCEIAVNSTATYSANEIVSVYGIGGATGCNGTWRVTVTDGTHLTLQLTTFGGVYTPSTGTVTDGSSFNVAGDVLACYFGTVMYIQNVLFQSVGSSLNVQQGCKVYLQAGNIFGGGSTVNHIFAFLGGAEILVNADIGIASGAGVFTKIDDHAFFGGLVSFNINFLPGINPTFSTAFAESQVFGANNYQGATINLNGNTVTGTRCAASNMGLILSGSGNANTYFPGNANCTSATGATVN